METIQVVLDKALLQETNRLAKRGKMNRSALVREALREYAKRARKLALEEKERAGYARVPEVPGEWAVWEAEAVWPQE